MNKKCPHCGSPITVRNGTRDGVQLYKCMACGSQFRGKVYLDKQLLWKNYLDGKQTMNELAIAYGVTRSTVKRLLRNIDIPWHNPVCRGHGVVQLDAGYFVSTPFEAVEVKIFYHRVIYCQSAACQPTKNPCEKSRGLHRLSD